MKSKRSKACDISEKVKEAVLKRDKEKCLFCNREAMPNAHYIPRSQGGLGIEENIITLCVNCHRTYDQTIDRKSMAKFIKCYLIIIEKFPFEYRCKIINWECLNYYEFVKDAPFIGEAVCRAAVEYLKARGEK